MDFFNLYMAGLPLVWDFYVIILLFIGSAIGLIFGVLPGLGPTMGVSLALPFTLRMNPQAAFAILLGVYCGATFGGSISAILVNIPGTPAALMTVLEGYPMSQRGEAGKAISLATISSFFGGLISVLFLALFAPLIAEMALAFSAQEYFSIVVFALSIIAYVSPGSMLKGFMSGLLGLLIATIGTDPMTAIPRFTFGNTNLLGGIELIPLLIGVFGISESLMMVEGNIIDLASAKVNQKIEGLIPKFKEIKSLFKPILRGSIIGTFIGAIPAAGGSTAAIVAYGLEKRISKRIELFGTGIPEGIAAPESANNGATGGAMIPMMTLGIPGDATTAVLLGGLMLHGLLPGPLLFQNHPGLVSAIFIMMALSNFAFLIYGLIGAKYFSRIITIPKIYLVPAVIVLCVLGTYSLRNNLFDVWILLGSGAIGYIMRKVAIPPAPMILGFILGSLLESNLRRALMLSKGDITTFFTRPLSLSFLILTVICCIVPFLTKRLKSQ